LLTFHLATPQKENLASTRRYTRSNLDPSQIPVYSDPENLVTWRNIREHHISSSSGNPYLETSPSVVHKSIESIDLIDILVDSHSSSKFPPEPLIDL
jgi:hypothetical protein